jgi:hypothetical protein
MVMEAPPAGVRGEGGVRVVGPSPVEVRTGEVEAKVARACGARNAADAELVGLVATVIGEGLWRQVGIVSPEHWVRWKTGAGTALAHALVRVASRLHELPVTAAAFGRGELSFDQVKAIVDHAPTRYEAAAARLAAQLMVPQLLAALRAYSFDPDPGAGGEAAPAGDGGAGPAGDPGPAGGAGPAGGEGGGTDPGAEPGAGEGGGSGPAGGDAGPAGGGEPADPAGGGPGGGVGEGRSSGPAAPAAAEGPSRNRRRLWAGFRDDGWYAIYGLLPPDEGALVDHALRAAMDDLYRRQHRPSTATTSGRRATAAQANGSNGDTAGPTPPAPGTGAPDPAGTGQAGTHHPTPPPAGTHHPTPPPAGTGDTTPPPDSAGTGTPDPAGTGDGARPGTGDARARAAVSLADAWLHLIDTAATNPAQPRTLRQRYRVNIDIDAHTLQHWAQGRRPQLHLGPYLGQALFDALRCDTSARIVLTEHGLPAAYGPLVDTIPERIRNRIYRRDRHCRYPGCTNRITEVHHLTHRAQGGWTTETNLICLCHTHHRAHHAGLFTITGDPTRADGLTFTNPHGTPIAGPAPPRTHPQPPTGTWHHPPGHRLERRWLHLNPNPPQPTHN